MDPILLNLNANFAAPLLNGSVGKQLIFVINAIKNKSQEIMFQISKKKIYRNAPEF